MLTEAEVLKYILQGELNAYTKETDQFSSKPQTYTRNFGRAMFLSAATETDGIRQAGTSTQALRLGAALATSGYHVGLVGILRESFLEYADFNESIEVRQGKPYPSLVPTKDVTKGTFRAAGSCTFVPAPRGIDDEWLRGYSFLIDDSSGTLVDYPYPRIDATLVLTASLAFAIYGHRNVDDDYIHQVRRLHDRLRPSGE